ncbi:MAG: CRISPR system Cascade subunit CasA [Akkermansiaceae bacterium]|jgi:CRISPR system Cascade subunit CasA
MEPFNLIDQPWIPIRWLPSASETPSRVSLATAFSKSTEIADLDCAPPERIAIMRLLICITHAALGIPENVNDWEDFGIDLDTDIPTYLRQPEIHSQFNLLGDGPRFLQDENSKGGTTYPLSKVCPELASGNNPTLLDHWGDEPRPWQAAQTAIALLCLQNFFIGGIMASAVKGNGPALKSLQLFLIGPNLRSSIRENCITEDTLDETSFELGNPNWESAPNHDYLSYLTPSPCALWLDDNLQRVAIKQGFQALDHPAYRDPFITIHTKADKRFIVRAQINKGIWRDLHLLTALRAEGTQDSALNLQEKNQRFPDDSKAEIKFWTGELIKAKDAKILDSLESTFTVNHALFTAAGNDIYSSGIEHAETVSKKLYGAIKTYGSSLSNEKPAIDEGQKNFWHLLDQAHRILIRLAGDPDSCLGKPAIGSIGADDPWTKAAQQAALKAYQTVCPASTPRQIQAYAAGIKPLLRALYPKAKKAAKKAAAKQTSQSELNL